MDLKVPFVVRLHSWSLIDGSESPPSLVLESCIILSSQSAVQDREILERPGGREPGSGTSVRAAFDYSRLWFETDSLKDNCG
jgi:hypothetical protein